MRISWRFSYSIFFFSSQRNYHQSLLNLFSFFPLFCTRVFKDFCFNNFVNFLIFILHFLSFSQILADGSSIRVPGYLSLHHTLSGRCILKWIPNFLMNGSECQVSHTSTPPLTDVDPNLKLVIIQVFLKHALLKIVSARLSNAVFGKLWACMSVFCLCE